MLPLMFSDLEEVTKTGGNSGSGGNDLVSGKAVHLKIKEAREMFSARKT